VVNADGVMVRGIPMPAQTVMFFSDSFTEKQRIKHNIHYVLPDNIKTIPPNSLILHLDPNK
jgi:hypothetical protein